MEYYDDITGERLKEWRTTIGLTQAQAAKLFGVARATFLNWENGGGIPNGVGSICAMAFKRWKMRDLFGFVTLVYTDGPMSQNAFGVLKIPLMQRELHRTNYDAINRAAELLTTQAAHTVFIVDEAGDVVWNVKELRKECIRRASTPPRIPVITAQEAKQRRKNSRILEVDVFSVPDKPGCRDVQLHLALPTGDEDEDFEIEQPAVQPGAVNINKIEEVIQNAARAMKAQYVVTSEGLWPQ